MLDESVHTWLLGVFDADGSGAYPIDADANPSGPDADGSGGFTGGHPDLAEARHRGRDRIRRLPPLHCRQTIMSLADDILSLGSEAPGIISGMAKVVKTIGPALSTVRVIVEDPAFPGVVTRIQTLHEIEASRATPTTPGPSPAPTAPVGIGLHRALPILDAVIFARRNPWAPWAVGAGLLLLVGGVGYRLGRRSRS